MPLLPGKANFNKNIAELIRSGRSRDQAVAIAHDVLRKGGKKRAKKKKA